MNLKNSIVFISGWAKRILRKKHRSGQKNPVESGEFLPEEIIAGLYPMNSNEQGFCPLVSGIGFR